MEKSATIDILRREWFFSLLIFGAGLFVLYHTILYKLLADWLHDPNYSHGLLLPFFSAYFIWINQEELARIPKRPCNWGLLVVFVGLFLLLLGWVAGELFTQRLSFLIVLYGGLIFLLGWPLAKKLAFPLGILILAIPIPYVIYNAVTFPLKLFVSKIATNLLQAIGLSVYRDGNIIVLPNMMLEVIDACSGIRSLISLLAVCVILAYFVRRWVYRVLLVLLSVPIAIVVNVLRVFITGILSYRFGKEAAEGFFHTFSGLLIFMLSIFLIGAVHYLVRNR